MNYHDMSIDQHVNYRRSGLFLSFIVAGIYTVLLFQGKHQPFWIAVAAVLALSALVEARPLCKAVDLIIGFGNFMHRFTNPLVFGLIYIVAVIPTALVLKLSKKDLLQLHYDGEMASYWKQPDGKIWKESFRKMY